MNISLGVEDVGLPRPNYEYITTEEGARKALSYIDKYPTISIDTETTGLDPYKAKWSLLQIGTQDKSFVFDVRYDTEHSSINPKMFNGLFTDNSKDKLVQNAGYDMKIIKRNTGVYLNNVYDTMLAEQLLGLGLNFNKAGLAALVEKYIGLVMPKEPRGTFMDYGQVFSEYQLVYAANDVVVLPTIRDIQIDKIRKEGLNNVFDLECRFLVPLCEMELNGICIDVERWRKIMHEVELEKDILKAQVQASLDKLCPQTTLFGVSLTNVDSNPQLKKALLSMGLELESVDSKALELYRGLPVIDSLLGYRKANKLISTYAEPLIAKINEYTGRLHTDFKQMVSTGRMSSSNPNLQNIPRKQKFRSCFIAKEGYSLITADMSGAELRILGNLSKDPIFIESYATGQDLHTRTASEVFGVSYNEVSKNKEMRNAAKAINFGLCTHEDTEVITNKGIIRIKDVSIGDVVAHDKGRDKIIDKAYMGKKEVFEIETKYGYTLEVTEDHLLKVIDVEGNYVDKRTKDVNLNSDLLCIKKGSFYFPESPCALNNFDWDYRTNAKVFDAPVCMSDDWASFIGLLISEGHLHKGSSGNYDGIQFGISEKDTQFVEYIDSLLTRLFGKFSRTLSGDVVNYSVNSAKTAAWIVSLLSFEEGKKTETIDVPDCIKCSTYNHQVSFLRSLFEGDGTISSKGKAFCISYSSKSYRLLKSLQTMLLNFGILSKIRLTPDKRYPDRDYYKLDIIGVDSQIKFIEKIGFITDRKNSRGVDNRSYKRSSYYTNVGVEKLKNLQKVYSLMRTKDNSDSVATCNRYLYQRIMEGKFTVGEVYMERLGAYDPSISFIYSNGIVPLPIKSIKSKGVKRVYDISVENHPYFLANGVVVHNCYGMSAAGLATRLNIKKKEAETMIGKYFDRYKGIKKYLDKAAKDAVTNRFSTTISGRKRYYSVPPYDHPDRKKIQGSIERQGMNAAIQGCLGANTFVKDVGFINQVIGESFKIETGIGMDTAIGVSSGTKDLYNLTLSNGVTMDITLCHKIPVISKTSPEERIEDKCVSNISDDDLLIIPLNITEGKASDLSGYKYVKGHWRETFVDYKCPNSMNSELSFIIGCLLGDGSYTKHNHFRFVCPVDQAELFDKYNSFVENQFGYRPKLKKSHMDDPRRKELPYSEVDSVVIRGFLRHIGLDYVKHEHKSIPQYFMTETIENRGALLNGLFSTDGGITKNSGPNFTTISSKLAIGVHQLLFTFGINSNLKTYMQGSRVVYRLQVPKRFNDKFGKYIGFSVNKKQSLFTNSNHAPKFGDNSMVPAFIPIAIEKVLRKNKDIMKRFLPAERSHLRMFSKGYCSFYSWRKFYNYLPECEEKEILSKYLNYDFCKTKSLIYIGELPAYDIMCDNIHYFTANGVLVHNSNADTIKESLILLVDRLNGYDARIVLTVHDEVIVEVADSQKYEVSKIVSQSLIDGFGKYFSTIPMETEALIGKSWLKGICDECRGNEMEFVEGGKYGTKLVCAKCGKDQE